jgi:uncharacterized membrane protein YjfL (UPF0719 family)
MAHGDASDLAFLAMLAIVVQLFAFPATLFEDIGPLKAQFTAKSSDMDAAIKLCGGLFLIIGMALTGVKWNPINGKMSGVAGIVAAGFTAYTTFKSDSEVFVPRLFYAYAAVLCGGAAKIALLPSNPMPEKTPEAKNNHGNFSDLAALALIGNAVVLLFFSDYLFEDIGPLKAQFKTKSSDLSAMISLAGRLMIVIALIFSGVKWNPKNGKGAGFGCFIASGYIAFSTFKADSDVLVPRIFYVYAAVLFFGAIHIFLFPSNPLPPKAASKKAN